MVAATSLGHLLNFPLAELPELSKGKGNKIIGIPTPKAKSREEIMVGLVAVGAGKPVRVLSGKRHLTLKTDDLDLYFGERARRGNLLPRGFRTVTGLEGESES